MRIIECTQKSAEWFEARRGIPTASRFDRICQPAKLGLATAHKKLITELLAETYYPGPLIDLEDGKFLSPHMEQGNRLEDEAFRLYAMATDQQVRKVGFIKHRHLEIGCSPDGLVGQVGGFELKCPKLATHMEYVLNGSLPDDYLLQVHGGLLCTGLQWWDFMSYYPGLPDGLSAFIVRTTPNDVTLKLAGVVNQFLDLYSDAKARIATIRPASPNP